MNTEIKQEKNRVIVISDIHGCCDEFIELIEAVKYNPIEDKLILLGDYIDRGKYSYKVIKKIQELQKENKNVIALRGNHEQMLIDTYNEKYNTDKKNSTALHHWMYNGGDETLNSFKENNAEIDDEIRWFNNLPYYYEDESRIYVHAGINLNKTMQEQNNEYMLWVREPFIYNSTEYNKQIIFGHTPSIMITGEYMPYTTRGDNICVDTGCVFGGKLTALIIKNNKTDGFIQVENEQK